MYQSPLMTCCLNNFRENEDIYSTPDLSQYEQVTKGDIISAFANIGKPVAPPRNGIDIESYSQDVWEPSMKQIGDTFDACMYIFIFSLF